PNFAGHLTFAGARAGTAHGLGVWFDAVLAEGVGFSNAPAAPEVLYGQAFFPWPSPTPLAAGDAVTVAFQARLVGDDYVWRWDSKVRDGVTGNLKADF